MLLPKLISIPAGTFLMGSDSGQDVERPIHRVFVDAFALAETQVTVAEYAEFLSDTKTPPPPTFNAVSWFDAVSYCNWLTSRSLLLGDLREGQRFRLPTEAEWEYAARGGLEGALFPWGDDPPTSRPNYSERWQHGPEPVRQSSPNGFGLYEMCENVHEWCTDWFDPNFYANSPDRNPSGPESGTRKSSRGGSWRHHVKISCCSTRSSIPPDFKYADYGFRIAMSR